MSGTAYITDSATLTVQLSVPLPDGSVIPILQAGSIEGNFSSVTVRDAPERQCDVSGELQETSTSVSVLLCVQEDELFVAFLLLWSSGRSRIAAANQASHRGRWH